MMPFASTSAAAAALCCLAVASSAAAVPPSSTRETKRAAPAEGYYDPLESGGSMLTYVLGTDPPLGEPLNVIISGNSHPLVLELGPAWTAFYNSIGYAGECLGQHLGDPMQANLGDGNGLINQTAEEREDYGDVNFGTCQETINGGNHFRWWVQNGTSADSGAIFLAVSYEESLALGHDIEPDGYDVGRNWLVGNATLGNGTTFGNYTFNTTVEMVSGLLPTGSDGVNHGISIDGIVAVLTVNVTQTPPAASTARGRRPQAGASLATLVVLAAAAWIL